MPEIESLPENSLFGKYELGKFLGCGASAKVYHARNVRTGQSVAVKVISKSKIAGTGLMANIKREISIMRRLHHPNIVKIYEVMASSSKIYVVMEYIKGGELFGKVAKGRFTENLGRKYFQQLISAVSYCHSRGVFHRDLKPENLLIDENGNLKVSDFGLSAVTGQIRPDGLLHTLCGTPAYVAPEILTRKGYDGAKVDLWSCGVILFVLTTGYLPFNDPNLMAMYMKIYKGEFRCPKWISLELKRFLSRILNTDPSLRITVDEIMRDPWFKKGFKEIKIHNEEYESCKSNNSEAKITDLNAFDLISFSSGLDLSGLFDESFKSVGIGERFIATESEPEKIIERVEAFATAESLKVVAKKELGVDLVGEKAVFAVDVYRLTEELVVVEARRLCGDVEYYRDIWNNKLRPWIPDRRTESAGN